MTLLFAKRSVSLCTHGRCRFLSTTARLKASFGTSANAVKSQIWIAVSSYALVAIVKKRPHLPTSLYEILQILSLTMFGKIPLDRLLAQTISDQNQPASDNDLILFRDYLDTTDLF
jgi:hypothetical protein